MTRLLLLLLTTTLVGLCQFSPRISVVYGQQQPQHEKYDVFHMVPANHSSQVRPDYDVSYTAPGYNVAGEAVSTTSGFQIPLTARPGPTDFYGKTIKELVVQVDYETEDRLHVTISDKGQNQIPVPDSPLGLPRPKLNTPFENPNYRFKYTREPFTFQVIRTSDNAVVFDTTDYPLVFEDQYLELTTKVPKDANLYGFGETPLPSFRRNNQLNATTVFARDAACPFYENIYGSHPMAMEIRNGKAHGMFLLTAHGMDVLTVEGRITFKIIGGVLEFYFFTPTDNKPNSVVRSYTDLVGKPMMISHWFLGFQHCRWGYHDIDEVEEVVRKYREHEIPLEVNWVDIDYMDTYKDFTFDPVHFPEERMKRMSDNLHANKQRFVLMVDAGKAYRSDYGPFIRGQELDVFMKNPDGSYYVGEVWPGYTVFPDWFHKNAAQYWDYEIASFMSRMDLDGLWIDMDEPSSFCLGSCGSGKMDVLPPSFEPWTLPQEQQDMMHISEEQALLELAKTVDLEKETRNLLYPNYAIHNMAGNLSEKTAPMIAYHADGTIPHYDLHNLYGHAECSTTRNAILKYKPNERPFIISRSTFSGSGHYAGHWMGDNWATWEYLKASIVEVFNVQMFGISYSGSDICGFNGNTTEELCTRWMQLGAFYPFARNHNVINGIAQEPYQWESTAEASRKALSIRYSLLPYLYTLHEESHRLGTGVWRPLVFEYPEIEAYLTNDEQVLIGTDILLTPVVTENALSVKGQFPLGTWYDWYTYEPVISETADRWVTLDAPLTHMPIHVRGGAIVPLKEPKRVVEDAYATPYTLLIALDHQGSAEGRLYIDDGHSVEQPETSDIVFKMEDQVLHIQGSFGYSQAEKLETIKIISAPPASSLVWTLARYDNGEEHSLVSSGLCKRNKTRKLFDSADVL
ncbi:alpha glucosidase [Zychaea mexicana]|uniref:alpha glucosidase n=1 Tax=Zychaea mexicana TaxID=64656 RepID=UPI0022FEAFD3|nr:alpha glucosidase [Zychaea mexicana]KAI9496829.1 alpha glucosidase [Zychaea mexicana]